MIEKLSANRARVTGLGRWDMSVEAPTRDAAIARFRAVAESTAKNVELAHVAIELPIAEHPLLRFAGDMKNDPLFDDWQDLICAYRAERDTEIAAEAR